MAIAAGLAAYAGLSADRLGGLLGVIGGAGVVLLALALVARQPFLVAPSLVVLGGGYAGLFLVRHGTTDIRAPLYGAAFLVVAELAFAALELRAGHQQRELLTRRVAFVAAIAIGGIVLGAITLAAATIPVDGGLALQAVGVTAAVGLGVALARIAVRAR